MDNHKSEIITQMPPEYRRLFQNIPFYDLEEIRFRIGKPIMLYNHNRITYLTPEGKISPDFGQGKIPLAHDLSALASAFCNHSVYAYINDLKDGFITLRGGHRVGIAGRGIVKNDEITNIIDISGVNIRIARAYPGCANMLIPHIKTSNGIKNTLLIAPPQCGKTTILRDLARTLSESFKITIVDERSEIAGCYNGLPQFDVGPQTDVLDRFQKSVGMTLALRSLSPQILVTDELGSDLDIYAVEMALHAGCRLVASIHGDHPGSLPPAKQKLLDYFDVAITLGRKNNLPAIINIQNLR